MQAKLHRLSGSGTKVFNADEKFWENVDFLAFHSEYLQIKLKKGRSTNYLHNEFYETVNLVDQGYSEEEKKRFFQERGCSYRFLKENEEFLNYLYEEAKKRKLIKPAY